MDRRAVVVAKLKELQGSAEKVVSFLTNPALVKQLRNDKQYNLEMLRTEHQVRLPAGRPPATREADLGFAPAAFGRRLTSRRQIGEDDIQALYHYAKFQFECGNYSGARRQPRFARSAR